MGGRLYHAALGRFFSADPVVTDPASAQDYNAYAYVSNNPLSKFDPSGYSWLSKGWKKVKEAAGDVWNGVTDAAKSVGKWIERNWRTLVVIVVAVVLTVLIGWTGIGNVATGFIVGAISGALAPALQGRPIGEIIKGAIIGAVLGAVTGGIGEYLGSAGAFFNNGVAQGAVSTATKAALHGVVGGIRSTLNGGSFWGGFATAAVAAATSVAITHIDNIALETIASSVVGGLVSQMSGGDFGDGMVIAAYSYIFNELGSKIKQSFREFKQRAARELRRNADERNRFKERLQELQAKNQGRLSDEQKVKIFALDKVHMILSGVQ